jgi:hypothetical protein
MIIDSSLFLHCPRKSDSEPEAPTSESPEDDDHFLSLVREREM